jgi:hypothetical protein
VQRLYNECVGVWHHRHGLDQRHRDGIDHRIRLQQSGANTESRFGVWELQCLELPGDYSRWRFVQRHVHAHAARVTLDHQCGGNGNWRLAVNPRQRARVDAFMMWYTEHRNADERFMARTETALSSVGQRIGRVERVQVNAA